MHMICEKIWYCAKQLGFKKHCYEKNFEGKVGCAYVLRQQHNCEWEVEIGKDSRKREEIL